MTNTNTNKIIDVSELSFSTEEELLSLKKVYNFFYSCVIYTHNTTDVSVDLFDESICHDESTTFSHLDTYIHSKNKVFDCIFFMDIDSLFNGINQVQMSDIVGFIKNISIKYNCHVFYRSSLHKNSIRQEINPIVIENHDKVNDSLFIDRPTFAIQKEADGYPPIILLEEPTSEYPRIMISDTETKETNLDDYKDVTFFLQENNSFTKSISNFLKNILINITDKF